ncbi:MAG: phage tail assembly protein [Sphaerochaetaceae bacterium]|nr:phage tail assembly protein [Sphaerochaetaceae bacterium]
MSSDIKNEKVLVDADEFAAAEKEAVDSEFTYIHKFKKPLEYQGKTYKELTFEWGDLTGKDGLSIENELQQIGKAVIVPTFSGEYLIRLAARACTAPLGADAFENMPISDYNKIRSAARSFLLKSELS